MQIKCCQLIIILLGLILISCNSNTQDDNAQQLDKKGNGVIEEKIPKQISLPKGLIKIFEYAYIDGRDLQAKPPLTIRYINIWDSYSRNRMVCKLAHGTKVKILDAKYDTEESRYYIKVKSENCEGWVSDPFISEKKMNPVGDIL